MLLQCAKEIDIKTHSRDRDLNRLGSNGKDKAITLQALTGPECSRRLRLPDFKIIGT
jgi:hypothetical protein